MRIGMILDAPFPPDYRVEKEALTLQMAGHEVVLFCLEYKKDSYEEDYKGIRVVHYSVGKALYKLSALAYTVPFYRLMMEHKLDDFIARFNPDILHVHDMVVAGAAFSAAKKRQLHVILDLHENRPASMREYRHTTRFPGNLLINISTWEKMQLELVRKAKRIVVVTTLAKEELVKESGIDNNKVFVVPNTGTLSFAQESINETVLKRMAGTFNLLYVGDTSLRRGTDDAIRAVALLKSQVPEIRLWIVGKSSADPLLTQLANELGVTDSVSFEGWQDQSLFATFMTGAHICLSPLKRNPHHDTTFANKLFQYMAMGRAVVVSDCVAQQRVVEDEQCGLVYQAGNVAMLAEKILTLYQDSVLLQTLGERGRRAVEERWNWEKTSEPLLEMYREI